ncbi:60S ribosomal protein L35 [Dirofilaria immitis]|nr:60S ribosomal protein L35 [Dirofilaria immitis]
MTKVKARDLRGKKKEELTKQLDEQKTELASLQVHGVFIGIKSSWWRRFETLEDSYCPKEYRSHFDCYQPNAEAGIEKILQGKLFKPLDIRLKKTRAMRRALTKHETNLKTKSNLPSFARFIKVLVASNFWSVNIVVCECVRRRQELIAGYLFPYLIIILSFGICWLLVRVS